MQSIEQRKRQICVLFICLTLVSVVGVLISKFIFNDMQYLLAFLVLFLLFWVAGFVSTRSYYRAFIAARISQGASKKEASALWHKKYPFGGVDAM